MKIKIAILFFVLSHLLVAQTHGSVANEKQIGVWSIKNGILMDTDQPNSEIAIEIWKVFYGLFPKKVTQKYIKQLVLFTDGPDEKTGALGTLNDGNSEWQLMLDIEDVTFKNASKEKINQSLYTLIHEFGHLITLNNTQIKPNYKSVQKSGEPYVTIEGEALKESYLNLFVNRFWQGSLLKEWDFIREKYCYVEQQSCIDHLFGLYEENYNDFLTDYAAESPEEDIVESWTAFVLDDKVKKPEVIAHKKVNFFYKFKELIKYRKIIRKNLRKYE